jgi:CubicO group peptidase (beta-lactamase class C family)
MRIFVIWLLWLGSVAPSFGAGKGVNRLDDETAARVDHVFQPYAKRDCPGCAVGIARDGVVLFTRGYGMANLEYSVPITPETIFEAGSVSKQFTAAAIQILAHRGKLSLEDDIRKYLPEVPDFGHVIRIRHLLNHTSGLRDQWGLLTAAGRPPGGVVHTLDEILDLVSRQKSLNFTPGTEHLYSNTGYSLLAWIVKRAGGATLADFSRNEVFRPLKMSSTQWRDDHTRIVKGRATAYMADSSGSYHTYMSITNVYGNGGLLSTVGDLLTWNDNFARPRIVGPELLDQMQTRSRLNGGEEIEYALGLQVTEYKGLREISHGGSTAGYRAFLARFPDQHLSIALLCNLGNVNPGTLAHQVADIFLPPGKDPPKPASLKVTTEALSGKAGLYRNLATDDFILLFVRDGKLMIGGTGGATELVAVASNRFRTSGGTEYTFDSAAYDAPPQVRQVPIRGKPTLYTSVPAAAPRPEKLAEYAGTYYSEELEVNYVVRIIDGRLTVRHRFEQPVLLEPAYADAFVAKDRSRILRFTRNAAGDVDGVNLFSGRVRHLRFVRASR